MSDFWIGYAVGQVVGIVLFVIGDRIGHWYWRRFEHLLERRRKSNQPGVH